MTCKCPKFDGCDMAKNWSISDPECGACTVAIASVSYVSKHLPLDDKWLWYISENLLTQASESLAKFDTFSGVTSSGCFENVLFSCNRSIQSPCIYKPTTAFKCNSMVKLMYSILCQLLATQGHYSWNTHSLSQALTLTLTVTLSPNHYTMNKLGRPCTQFHLTYTTPLYISQEFNQQKLDSGH